MGALTFGVVIFAIVDWDDVSSDLKMLTLFGAATAVSMYVLSFIIPMVMTSSANEASTDQGLVSSVQDKDVDSAFQTYLSGQIVHCAMLEGGIFLNLMVFMLDRSLISMVVAGLGFGILLVAFPSDSRILSRVTDLLPMSRPDGQLKR